MDPLLISLILAGTALVAPVVTLAVAKAMKELGIPMPGKP